MRAVATSQHFIPVALLIYFSIFVNRSPNHYILSFTTLDHLNAAYSMPAIKRCQGIYLHKIVDSRLEVINAKGLNLIASTDLLKKVSVWRTSAWFVALYALCEQRPVGDIVARTLCLRQVEGQFFGK
jgi:hypothetical protein